MRRSRTTNETDLENLLYCRFTERYHEFCDDIEISYPSKFADVIRKWDVTEIIRSGRFTPHELYTDEEIIKKLTGISEGENPYLYFALVNPKYESKWQEGIEKAKYVLQFNQLWTLGYDWFLNKIKQEMPSADVSICIYDLGFILMSLYHCISQQSLDFLPRLEIIAQDKEKTLILTGQLSWDGTTFPKTVRNTLPKPLKDDNIFIYIMSGQIKQYNTQILAKYGLHHSLVETEMLGEKFMSRNLDVIDNKIQYAESLEVSKQPIEDFFASNLDYLNDITNFFGFIIQIPAD